MLFSNERTHNQERRVSARRGVSNVLARENEFVVRGERQNQERWASARRGWVNRFCKCNAMNFRISRSHARSAFHRV
jgi:hypothetical protein